MASFYCSIFLLVPLLSLLHQPVFSGSDLLTKSRLFRSQSSLHQISPDEETTPTTFFEVTKPIKLPKTQPCSYLVLQHDFGYTYGKPPVLAQISPPTDCPSQNFDKIVLEWKATCKGRQFDRIFGVWIGGVEVLRSCTAEPRVNGIVWTVEKDITRYSSLFKTNQTLAVYIGNLIDSTYTGVYHVNVSIHFYPAEKQTNVHMDHFHNFDSGADVILPISRNLPLNDGLWFEIENSTDVESKEFKIPQNVYRAVLEVYVSYHENDEFWYGNFPNEYINANNISGAPGNGPFRELIVSLDDELLGAVWPFTVVFTGGINPLLWRPISAIGSFNLPSYDIEITPLLGKILDGKTHRFGFSVTNALNVWYVDANLHLWLDKKSAKTEGKLLESYVSPLNISAVSKFSGYDGTFITNASRLITNRGWVKSSYGTIITKATQGLQYSNVMVLGNEGSMQIVNQTIQFDDKVHVKAPFSSPHLLKSIKRFPFYLYSNNIDHGNNSFDSVANVTLGFKEKKIKVSGSGHHSVSSLKNLQSGQGSMLVKDNLVQSGLGSTQQVYSFDDNKSCYFRNISSSNYTILYDNIKEKCSKKPILHLRPGHLHLRW